MFNEKKNPMDEELGYKSLILFSKCKHELLVLDESSIDIVTWDIQQLKNHKIFYLVVSPVGF